MEKIQDIVPVSLKSDSSSYNTNKNQNSAAHKPKAALQIKRDNMDITIYNGCNNYILNAALGVLNSHAN
ncbi:hypothetical protein [Vagococcus fluvialis]|uniref:hypothetical protein n=1 Tax=Vagococcus fluvialis TaxID=2738 RepID=UPI001D09EB02|nr:hypothetical protein [Vagococcus fluvialis]UDM70631.1 hypothetical protein K5L00_10915 [Vagococcus fluvialis]UDM71613.1 hypothetical protein K5L00_02300 [Vagococcus fluvialis]UDM76475.1 hypothetical protein K5K98_12100 [Vagococcus fluvialis]UDM78050.1 hypothetical protein K5K98_06450 [Vagococcus fluvialis]UDM82319.1 hypothetical protein K5K96_13390 [Vagococcus fluvialis]